MCLSVESLMSNSEVRGARPPRAWPDAPSRPDSGGPGVIRTVGKCRAAWVFRCNGHLQSYERTSHRCAWRTHGCKYHLHQCKWRTHVCKGSSHSCIRRAHHCERHLQPCKRHLRGCEWHVLACNRSVDACERPKPASPRLVTACLKSPDGGGHGSVSRAGGWFSGGEPHYHRRTPWFTPFGQRAQSPRNICARVDRWRAPSAQPAGKTS